MDFTKAMNDQRSPINPKLKKALNKFFSEVDCASGCILRKDWEGADYALIIEESDLYYHLQGEYGWNVHTAFHKAFDGTGFFPEMQNSCVVGFYKD
jgi:hypothetical protein